MEKIVERDGRKFWLIQLDQDEVFGRLCVNAAYREHTLQSGGSGYVLLEDDRVLATMLVRDAVAELWQKLGRMGKQVEKALRYSDDSIVMTLAVNGNQEDSMIFVLDSLVGRFIDAWVLRQWFDRNGAMDAMIKCEAEAAAALDSIVTIIHYRKKTVRRPLDPVI